MSYCLLSYQIFMRVQAMRSHMDLYLEPHNSFAWSFGENIFLLIAFGDLIICLTQNECIHKILFLFFIQSPFCRTLQWQIQDFLRRPHQFHRWEYEPTIWIFFLEKLHQKERNWTERRGTRPWHLSWVCQFIIYINLSLLNVSIIV